MSLPFDITHFKDKYSLTLGFNGLDLKNDECPLTDFHNFLKDLDEKLVTIMRSRIWNTKKQKLAPLLKKQGRFPANFKVKLPMKKNKFDFTVYDHRKERISVTQQNIEDVFSKGSDVRLIVQITCAWITDSRFGISMKVRQAQVFRRINFTNISFVEDSDDDEFDFDS